MDECRHVWKRRAVNDDGVGWKESEQLEVDGGAVGSDEVFAGWRAGGA